MNPKNRCSLTVCLVTFNRRELLLKALESLRAQSIPVSEIILVDNASSDGTIDSVMSGYPEVRVIRLHENKGCPPARNIAMANAHGDFIVNLDDDGAFAPEALEHALELFNNYPQTGIVMMDIVEDGISRSPNVKDGQIIPVFSAGCSVIKADVLEQCGYFDDHIFRQGEEYDFSIRVLDADWEIRFSRKATMFHFPPRVLRADPRIQYLGALNKSLALVKFAPFRYLLPDLTRRLGGYSLLFLRKGRLDLALKLPLHFLFLLPRALRSRKVHERGYSQCRKLHKSYVR